MIPRYSRAKMSSIWEIKNKFSIWMEIECHIADIMSKIGEIPKEAAKKIKKKSKFDTKRIEEIEKKTKHDFVAFLTNLSENIGDASKYIHKGITSSDVIDTAFSIQLNQASNIIIKDIEGILKTLKHHSIKYKYTPIVGRSHGVHAETTTFGLKLAGYYSEFKRNLYRMKMAKQEISICQLSGPVGNYGSIDPKVEKYLAKKMKLKIEPISTQIIPRDRHAFFFSTIAIIASSAERLATEIRNLSRTEILEVEEYFNKGQKGSSAMPHKRNPVLSENITGLARYVRSGIIPSLENIVLWHERDISHSSVERIIAPDSTIAIDFILDRLNQIIKNLLIYPKNMRTNIDKLRGLNNSQFILLSLIDKGLSREQSYEIVQRCAMKSYEKKISFRECLINDNDCKKYLSEKLIDKIIYNQDYKKNIDKILKRVFAD